MSETRYKVVLIGAGQVAHHLAHRIDQLSSVDLVQIFSRRLTSAQVLTEALLSTPTPIDDLTQLVLDADYYIFCISDSALSAIWRTMPSTRGIWLHTAGSVPLSLMLDYHPNIGVLYPLQTFSHNRALDWSHIPIYVEASTPDTLARVQAFASLISPIVYEASSSQRLHIHLSAVLVCNFVNHLWTLGEEWMQRHNLEPQALLPLMEETLAKAKAMQPREAQTGPARRGDRATIDRHLSIIGVDNPHLAHLYTTLSESIERMYNNTNE